MDATNLLLIDDDSPGAFAPRRLRVVRDDLRVGSKPGIAVSISPPVKDLGSGELLEAVLVLRHVGAAWMQLTDPTPRSLSVYVCRTKQPIAILPADLRREDLTIELWGRVATTKAGLKVVA